jgi:uncharacterized protein YozE (UPF0346 family)
MSNSFTTTIYNEITSDLSVPKYKNNNNIHSIFLNQQGGGVERSSTSDNDINNLLSMLTTESNLNTSETIKIENRLKSTMQKGGSGHNHSVTSSDNYSQLFISSNKPLSETSVNKSITSSVLPPNNILSATSVAPPNETVTSSAIPQQKNHLSTTSVLNNNSVTSSVIPQHNNNLSETSDSAKKDAIYTTTEQNENNLFDAAKKMVEGAVSGITKLFK